MGPEPLPTVCNPDLQIPPNCQPGSSDVFCQPLDENEWEGLVRPKRALTPLSSAGVEPQPPADRQHLIAGDSALYLPFEPNDVHHSVHKRAIITVTTIVASIVSAIQLWITTAGTAVAAASTGLQRFNGASTLQRRAPRWQQELRRPSKPEQRLQPPG